MPELFTSPRFASRPHAAIRHVTGMILNFKYPTVLCLFELGSHQFVPRCYGWFCQNRHTSSFSHKNKMLVNRNEQKSCWKNIYSWFPNDEYRNPPSHLREPRKLIISKFLSFRWSTISKPVYPNHLSAFAGVVFSSVFVSWGRNPHENTSTTRW